MAAAPFVPLVFVDSKVAGGSGLLICVGSCWVGSCWVLFHQGEALVELQKVTSALESGPVSEEEFEIAIEHAYHHLNTAWNSRSITDDQAKEHTDSDFVNWRRFPKDLNLS